MNRRAFLPLVAALLPLAAGWAQQTRVVTTRTEPALYEFKNLSASSAHAVCHVANTLFGVLIEYSPEVRIALISPNGPGAAPDWREKTIDFLKKYDVPPPPEPQVRYVAYLIRASNGKEADSPHVSPIPRQLDDAITEMKSSLAYARYDLLTTVTSVSQGGASASDPLPADGRRYAIEYGHVTVAPDHKSISINPFQFRLESPGTPTGNVLSSISSNITIHEGQKLVMGKVHYGPDADIFVILTAKVE
jgi:hypothetical protein